MMPLESAARGSSRSPNPMPVRQGELVQIDRRSWLAAAGTLLAGVATRRSGAVPPSDRIRIGAIGIGNRGRLLLEQLPADAELVAICDCNLPLAARRRGRDAGDSAPAVDLNQLHVANMNRMAACIKVLREGGAFLPTNSVCRFRDQRIEDGDR